MRTKYELEFQYEKDPSGNQLMNRNKEALGQMVQMVQMGKMNLYNLHSWPSPHICIDINFRLYLIK